MKKEENTPIYLGGSPLDCTTYALPFNAKTVEAVGVGGSDEPIKVETINGKSTMACPTWVKNPEHIKFTITL